MRKFQILGKLKMQYCAILSQVHRHKDALEHAREGVRISHLLIEDLKQLCEFYIKREDIEVSITKSNNQSRNMLEEKPSNTDYSSYTSKGKDKKINSSRNRSFSNFLSHQEAYEDV
jgi:hypothetical protein